MDERATGFRVFRFATAALCGFLGLAFSTAGSSQSSAQVLIHSGVGARGEQLEYPPGKPDITVAMVTMPPGGHSDWHRHQVPFIVYVLDGEITVDYGSGIKQHYKPGQAFIEAFRTDHRGMNEGTVPVRALAIYIGSDSVRNTVPAHGAQ